jgi:hypothetical protein
MRTEAANLVEAEIWPGGDLQEMKALLEAVAQEQTLRAQQPERFEAVLAVLNAHDASSLATERLDYSAEVSTILPRLPGCHCIADFARVVREEFAAWGLPGREESFTAIANALAQLF